MLYNQLQQVHRQIRRHEIKLSDALLLVFRYLRDRLPSERLVWMNRELLGYRADDLEKLYKPRARALYVVPTDGRLDIEIPKYRFLAGSWGRLDEFGQLICCDDSEALADRTIFCNIGIQQIETQIDELQEPDGCLFSMSIDPTTGAEFYCWSEELVRVYESVSHRLGEFISNVIEELKLAPNER